MEHADVLDAAARRLDVTSRELLYRHRDLAKLAQRSTPSQFRCGVAQLVREVQTDDGIDTFEHQRAAARFDCRFDHRSGMYRLDGWLDPERGATLSGKLHARVEALFHDAIPDGCPTDPIERQAHLRALALVDLAGDTVHGQPGVVEMSIVVDIDTLRHGGHERSLIEFGSDGAVVPIETLRRHLCLSERAVILMRDGVGLAMGRERRVATRAQRTMTRAMYPTCAITGCEIAFERCELHHIVWWRHGGTTDLANLVPLCTKHHHCAHEGGWQLALDPDTRVLTVTFPTAPSKTCHPLEHGSPMPSLFPATLPRCSKIRRVTDLVLPSGRPAAVISKGLARRVPDSNASQGTPPAGCPASVPRAHGVLRHQCPSNVQEAIQVVVLRSNADCQSAERVYVAGCGHARLVWMRDVPAAVRRPDDLPRRVHRPGTWRGRYGAHR